MSASEVRCIRRLCLSAFVLMLSGCAAYSVVNNDRYSNTSTAIPHDERPPAGQCRLWYDDRRVSEQPPAGDCERLERSRPHNARLIHG